MTTHTASAWANLIAGAAVVTFAAHRGCPPPLDGGRTPSFTEAELQAVFRLVLERTGVDLALYRRGTVERRLVHWLQKRGVPGQDACLQRLAQNPAAAEDLLEHVTIKVSRFFRNVEVFDRLRRDVLPLLIRRRQGAMLRFWSAGCGNGEEPYSLAILMAELAAEGQPAVPTLIYATDLDEKALDEARRGTYSPDALSELTPALVDKYFTSRPGRFGPRWEISAAMREKVCFGRQDLLGDGAPPEELFDLVLCRNVVIYFERLAQERVFRRLAASLLPGGCLCLGEAEQPARPQEALFEVVDRRAGLYRRLPQHGKEDAGCRFAI